MITAVDTNVLLDVFADDPTFGPRSQASVCAALRGGAIVACDVVWAEVSSFFPSEGDATQAMQALTVEFSRIELEAALVAGKAWREYRRRGGSCTRVVADFLVGAHARAQADQLLTRDRGFYRTYFARLRVVDPAGTG